MTLDKCRHLLSRADNRLFGREDVPRSFLLPFAAIVFNFFRALTIRELFKFLTVRHLFHVDTEMKHRYDRCGSTYLIDDIWAVIFLAISATSFIFRPVLPLNPWLNLLCLFGIFYCRIWEIVVLQANALLFDHFRVIREKLDLGVAKQEAFAAYKLRSYRRRVMEALLNYAEIVFWFALLYYNYHDQFARPDQGGLNLASRAIDLAASIQMTSSFGGVMPLTTTGAMLAVAHSSTGIFMTVIVIAFTISLLGALDLQSLEPTEQSK